MLYRDTWIEINLDHFKHNIIELQKKTKKAIFCVVKANAYGHGDVQIVKEAIACGCEYIAVSSLDEAMHLRNHHKDIPILILGYVNPEHIELAIENSLTLTATSLDWVNSLPNNLKKSTLKIHLKVDTGMNRLGIKKITEIEEALSLLKEKGCIIEGIYTHFHSADAEDKTSAHKQQKWFHHVVNSLNHSFTWVHSANSDAALSLEDDSLCNAMRIGLALYGISNQNVCQLHPVLSLYSKITHIKKVNKGETVGYGATYTCPKDEWIATLPIGYGDGFIRANQGRFVCIEGHPYEIVGRVCMDQCMIQVDNPYPVGTTVELIGEYCDLVVMAKQLHTIPYEILCLLSDRIPRIYTKEGNVISTLNIRNRFHH